MVFSWWDRLHRSACLNVPQSAIRVGVPAYANPQDNTFGNTLTLPFRRQRDYWTRIDGTPVLRNTSAVDTSSRLAE